MIWGHTPFGHAGERALNEVCPGGYKHFLQSVRVVEKLENSGRGLLTSAGKCGTGSAAILPGREAETLEGRIVRVSDKIAYMNHDVDDAVQSRRAQ